jgi:hypothetical protein
MQKTITLTCLPLLPVLSLFSGGQRRREAPQLSDHFYVASASETHTLSFTHIFIAQILSKSQINLLNWRSEAQKDLRQGKSLT